MIDFDDTRLTDFSGCSLRRKTYGGANGEKLSIEYNNAVYMLKFSGIAHINKGIHYTNSCVSEYLGCHIFHLLGVPAQKTILGKYEKNGVSKVVVACKDITFLTNNENCSIQDFISTKNAVIDSSRSGHGTELSSVLEAIDKQVLIEPSVMLKRFWEMFVVDAFIGNWDRHNGNWGILYQQSTDEILGLAPVFDCGSCLYPQADEMIMKSVIEDERELELRVYERPLSALTENGRKINYFDFLMETKIPECMDAIRRIVPKINMNEIEILIKQTPGICEISQKFYCTVLRARKELILDRALERVSNFNFSYIV